MSKDSKYQELYNDVKNQIISNNFSIGDVIESENNYSKKYNISRTTVKKAIVLLEKEGLIKTRKGYGSTVISNVPRKRTILLVVNDIYSYIYKDMISGIELYLKKHGFLTIISLSYMDFDNQTENLKNLVDKADGIILDPIQTMNVDLYRNEDVYKQLLSKPTVLLSANIEGFDLPCVKINDFQATKHLTEKLIKKGKQKFLLVVNTIEKQGLDRQLGILEVLNIHDTPYEIIETTRQNEDEIHNLVYSKQQNFKPDVIMFYNDSLVLNYLIFIRENGLSINYAITGFDNIELPFLENVEFYSPSHPKRIMGEKAAEMLVNLINGELITSYSYDL